MQHQNVFCSIHATYQIVGNKWTLHSVSWKNVQVLIRANLIHIPLILDYEGVDATNSKKLFAHRLARNSANYIRLFIRIKWFHDHIRFVQNLFIWLRSPIDKSGSPIYKFIFFEPQRYFSSSWFWIIRTSNYFASRKNTQITPNSRTTINYWTEPVSFGAYVWVVRNISLSMYSMAIRVVEFSNGGYKIRKIFAWESAHTVI